MNTPEYEVEGQVASLTALKEGVGFTPGPWAVAEFPSHLEFGAPLGTEMLNAWHPLQYVVGRTFGHSITDKANARLIAAAPALYEALNNIVREFDDADNVPPRMALMERGRSALKSALGE